MPISREGYLWTPSGATTGLTTDAVVTGTPISAIHDNYDVIVIGTGFAGLIAARDLSKNTNKKVLLVEGRDRIGGRTWTAKALGEDFEMGGTWVHWNQPHVYAELHRYDLHSNLKQSSGAMDGKTSYYTPALGACNEMPSADADAAVQRVADAFFSIDGLSSRDLMPYPHEPLREPALWKKYDHLSAKDRLDQLDLPQAEKDIFDAMISTFGSVPGSVCGFTEALRWYALGNHNMAGVFEMAGVFKLGKGGMTSFARAILSEYRGHLLFDTVIDSFTQDGKSVTLTGKNGLKVKAKYAISTIPLNCLSDVTFSPPLSPIRQEAIKAGHVNQGAKIHFHLTKAEPGWFSVVNGYGVSPWLFGLSDHNGTSKRDGTYCIGFSYSSHLTKREDSANIISTFKQFVKPGAEVKEYLTHDWMNDPLAKGVWACWGPNSASKWLEELQKPDGRIFFASGDWANGWRGFVDGAIESGGLAGRRVERLLLSAGPNSKL